MVDLKRLLFNSECVRCNEHETRFLNWYINNNLTFLNDINEKTLNDFFDLILMKNIKNFPRNYRNYSITIKNGIVTIYNIITFSNKDNLYMQNSTRKIEFDKFNNSMNFVLKLLDTDDELILFLANQIIDTFDIYDVPYELFENNIDNVKNFAYNINNIKDGVVNIFKMFNHLFFKLRINKLSINDLTNMINRNDNFESLINFYNDEMKSREVSLQKISLTSGDFDGDC